MTSFRQACSDRSEALLRRARLEAPILERAGCRELQQEVVVLSYVREVATTDAEAIETLSELGRSAGSVGAAARRAAAALAPAGADVELTDPLPVLA